MMYKCPHCEKYFPSKGKLNSHIARVHGSAIKSHIIETKPGSTQHFEVKKPAKTATPEKPDETTKPKYHCLACGGNIAQGENPCPHCGAQLNWDAL